jgi:signal transduction histidine kinase/ActR/RegA family two-component response regulator
MNKIKDVTICPVTGFTVVQHNDWSNRKKDNYTYTYRKIGDQIIYVCNSGDMKDFDIEYHYQSIEKFINDVNIRYPFIEIRDTSGTTGKATSAAVRRQKEYILENEDRMAGFILCNTPFWLRTIASAALRRFNTTTRFLFCKNYEDALTKARDILGDSAGQYMEDTGTYRYEMLEFQPQWQYENPDKQVFYRSGVVKRELFYSSMKADYLDYSDYLAMKPYYEQVFKDGMLTGSNYIRVVDYTGMKKSSIRARKEYAKLQIAMNEAYQSAPVSTYICGANLFIRSTLKVFSTFVNQKFVFVDTVKQAFDRINSHSEKQKNNPSITVTQNNIDEITDFCGMLLWDEDEARLGDLVAVSEKNPLADISETISLIQSDLIDLRRKEIEQAGQLKKAAKLAQAANDAKTQFLGTMSHELRTPLNGIIGMLDLVSDTSMTETQTEMIQAAKISADHLQELVDGIFNFILMDSRQFKINTHQFNLKDLLDRLNQNIQRRADEKQIEYRFSMDNKVTSELIGDNEALTKVLNQLIGNAFKFTHHGIVSVQVSVKKQEATTQTLLFEIRDTGIGIPKEKQGNLFQLFSQLDSSDTREYGGAGMGLILSKRLVQLMGGTIGFESEKDQGSRFWAEITFQKAEIAIPEKPALLSRIPADKTMPVLVVDDNKVNQKVAGNMLKKMGYRVKFADNGLEAVESVKKEPFALVFMDIQMPVMDGEEAVMAIRKLEAGQNRHTPIIALTANAMNKTKAEYLSVGLDEYMTKPVKKDILKQKIERVREKLSLA